ncbi:MAG: hypothetical protein J0H83_08185 [Candidatus Melainabacteria bacterium]|jgi:hypothetical protein|nr:hypothetical protein [Candidatus Melainabacteria bacterium]MBX9672469.1 hypothetical protein [Candidatus Obscuribacterales bacterium]
MADAVEIDAANEKLDGQNRIGGLASFFEACKYLDEAKADKTVQVRAGDKHTALCLESSVVAALVFLVLPFLGLSKYAAYCLSAADFFFTVALGAFIVGRFGILKAMNKRQALVTWQLMVGTCLMSFCIAINIAFVVVLFSTVH